MVAMRLALLCIALVVPSIAQEGAFEVASVRPSTPTDRIIGLFTYPGGRITITNYSLGAMLEAAFQVQPFQIVGGAGWVQEDRYSVVAKPPASSQSAKANPRNSKLPPNDEQCRMLQTLLIDRFHLKLRQEIREAPVFLLTRNNRKLRLQPAKDPNEYPWAGSVAGAGFSGDGIRGENITLVQLAERISPYFERPVIDQTGISGSYDFRVPYSFDKEQPDIGVSLVACLRELGFKLEAGKGPVKTIVIEHAERPSAN
jgi:uncharacterized protein (TIGR03435 family)